METPLPGLNRPGLKSPGTNLRIGEPCVALVLTAPPGLARSYVRRRFVTTMLLPHSSPALRLLQWPDLLRRPQRESCSPRSAANEARKPLIHKELVKYVGIKAVVNSVCGSDSWLMAPVFNFGDERSRNVIDIEWHRDLSRRTPQNCEGVETRSRHPATGNGYMRQSSSYTGGGKANRVAGGVIVG